MKLNSSFMPLASLISVWHGINYNLDFCSSWFLFHMVFTITVVFLNSVSQGVHFNINLLHFCFTNCWLQCWSSWFMFHMALTTILTFDLLDICFIMVLTITLVFLISVSHGVHYNTGLLNLFHRLLIIILGSWFLIHMVLTTVFTFLFLDFCFTLCWIQHWSPFYLFHVTLTTILTFILLDFCFAWCWLQCWSAWFLFLMALTTILTFVFLDFCFVLYWLQHWSYWFFPPHGINYKLTFVLHYFIVAWCYLQHWTSWFLFHIALINYNFEFCLLWFLFHMVLTTILILLISVSRGIDCNFGLLLFTFSNACHPRCSCKHRHVTDT